MKTGELAWAWCKVTAKHKTGLDGQPLADGLARQLEREIIDGLIKPGEELDERRLAERFGVSRTPIREALRRLDVERLVELRPRRSAIVRSLTAQNLAQMFEVLSGLEAFAAECAARRMNQQQIEQLQHIHLETGAVVKAGDRDGFDRLNFLFHQEIYQGAGNPYLHEQLEGLRTKLAPYRRWLLRRLDRMRQSHNEHAAILAAIETGDGARAAAEMRRHICDPDRLVDFMIMEQTRG
ncbi:GntR family transcriptional regulator [Nitratireductor pacificus]|uniref:GntR family transcriptional regulator n=1 Tax=Nitratireductor pacificus pht-3B TaxID=391937 RepID=K2LNS8_9HYPH|nr:GntR family transcriptional regulator [Nitratireductor pacificus]EKF19419.1 GntR family transcriptional regulator [Nitratireductor pacificus pht-3B]